MKTTPEIKKLSDGDLLEYVCANHGDEVAYSEFVNRFLSELQDICEKLCARKKLDDHIGLQIAIDCFEKARRSASFDKRKANQTDERKAVVGYLYRVAYNLFTDHYNNSKKEVEYHSTYFDELQSEVADLNTLQNQKEVTDQILKKLNKKEQRVLLVDIEYKRHHRYLPDNIIDALSVELGVKPASIRKLRERAKNKVKIAIDEYNEGK